jgi:phosphatidyl-myo-inositol dimannoside synthase
MVSSHAPRDRVGPKAERPRPRPTRHLFVTRDYAPDLGGMARRHVELCRRFPPGEIAVSTVQAPGAAAFDAGEFYAIHRQPFSFKQAKLAYHEARWARSLVRRVRHDAVALVHCGNVRPTGYAVWWAHHRTAVPYLLYVNGGDLLQERRKARDPLKRRVARTVFAGAAGVVANSAWTAAVAGDVMREAGVRRLPPVAAIDLGTDPTRFHPSRDRRALRARYALGDAPLLLTVARLVPHKGQDAAVRALAALVADFPGLRYLLVGEGPDEPRLRSLAAELGVADRVVFAGALPDDDVAEAYATATVYVGLSRLDRGLHVEGFGISFVEAGASGAPSVAGDSGGVRSAVRDGETGLVVPPEDAGAATAALRALLADPARRDAMGRAARRAVELHYNWDRVARETLAFANSVLAERAARTASSGPA